jgi:tetratricopeptide (TPR) repeat protein
MLSLVRHDEKGLGEMAGKAAALLEPLAASDPQDLRTRYLLAHAYGFEAAARPDGSPQALELLRKALMMSLSLTAVEPENPSYSVATAGSYSELGTALQASGDLTGALENQRRAAVIFEAMAARDPRNAQVRRNLATLLCLVGELALEQEGAAAAIPVLKKSMAVFEAMPTPHNIQTGWGLAKTQFILGDAYRRQGQPQRTAALFRPSSQVLRDMRSRGVLPEVNAAFADRALAAMAGFLAKKM